PWMANSVSRKRPATAPSCHRSRAYKKGDASLKEKPSPTTSSDHHQRRDDPSAVGHEEVVGAAGGAGVHDLYADTEAGEGGVHAGFGLAQACAGSEQDDLRALGGDN